MLLGGVDVLDLDLQQLRAAVGVVTQRTEILAGTLAENITLFADRCRAPTVEAAVAELGLDGLGGRACPRGSTPCSARAAPACPPGEEQLVAFARLLVRDVRVVVLDEATARMDPVTEAHVVRAADRLLAGRTGMLVAHRLSTTERAEQVAVLDGGRVVQQGPRARAGRASPARSATLLEAAAEADEPDAAASARRRHAGSRSAPPAVPARRRRRPQLRADPRAWPGPPRSALFIEPQWGLVGMALFLVCRPHRRVRRASPAGSGATSSSALQRRRAARRR